MVCATILVAQELSRLTSLGTGARSIDPAPLRPDLHLRAKHGSRVAPAD